VRRVITLAALVCAGPTAYLLAHLAAAVKGSRRPPPERTGATSRIAVVVPAHDEEDGIAVAVTSLAAAGSESTIVVADNCTDATAERARAAGATVWERHDPERPGKGHALAWAFDRIGRGDADAVAVVDADCTVSENLLDAFGARLAAGARALQASYMVLNPQASPAAAARYGGYALVNHVRPLARSTLGLSCGLTGSGMAFALDLLLEHPWDAFDVTEDSEYHLRLVEAGERVEFVPEARVESAMPVTLAAAATQRERWESGGFELARGTALHLIARGVRRRDSSALNAGIELLIPPQSLQLAANVATATAAVVLRAPLARRLAVFGLAGQVVYVLGGLALVRAPAEAYRGLALGPLLAVRNAGLYARLARGWRPSGWVRTPREGSAAAPHEHERHGT
jgi:cellulose synthase/poly-beta-1,6-N-acetylglucosamine synthase-like glycosyltransferase